MSRPSVTANGGTTEKSFFEQQREMLMRDIGTSMEQVLQNINKLNRSLESIISVGGEFSAVEALWSHFENVMSKDPKDDDEENEDGDGEETEIPGNDKQ